MVLGIEWFKQLGEIVWDFNIMTMQFKVDGLPMSLKGVTHSGTLCVVEGTVAQKRQHDAIQFCLL